MSKSVNFRFLDQVTPEVVVVAMHMKKSMMREGALEVVVEGGCAHLREIAQKSLAFRLEV